MTAEPTARERLDEIRSKAFEDLTPEEMLTWSTADPEEYYAAAMSAAHRMVEREVEAARRRRAAQNRERAMAPFRWLARLWGGGRRA